MTKEREIEELRQIRNFLISYEKKSFGGWDEDKLRDRIMEMSEVSEYRDIIRALQRRGHNTKPFEITDDMFDPPAHPTTMEELQLMLQKVERGERSTSPEGVEYYWINAIVVKKKIDAAIAYIDSRLPKPPKTIGFQQTPVL